MAGENNKFQTCLLALHFIKNEAYIRLIGFIRELYQSQKIKAMVLNKQNITLHRLHVYDGARFLVGFLCRCYTTN